MEKILFKNIGILFTGDLEQPIASANAIIVEEGKIVEVGTDLSIPSGDFITVDVHGAAVCPGLIDCHCHTAIGDWAPRQRALNWIEPYLKAGVTGLISAGEAHVPGRPRDAEGCKALAILAYKTSQNYRPAGMKVYGGALIMEPDATEEDFADCARIGMRHTGEFGLGRANSPETAAPMAEWARKHGLKTLSHTGGTFLAGSSLMDTETILGIGPDVICHLSGGAIPYEGMRRLLEETDAQVEICRVHFTNPKCTLELLDLLKERDELKRLMLGNDAPSGMGIFPHGIWELICLLSSMGDLEPGMAIALGTGNTACFYDLPVGMLKPGYCADLLVIDSPVGAYTEDAYSSIKEGLIPGLGLVMVDGKILAEGEKQINAPLPQRMPTKHYSAYSA